MRTLPIDQLAIDRPAWIASSVPSLGGAGSTRTSQPRQSLRGFGHAARLAHALGTPKEIVRGHGGRHEVDHGGLPTRGLQAQGALGIHNRLDEAASHLGVASRPNCSARCCARVAAATSFDVQQGTSNNVRACAASVWSMITSEAGPQACSATTESGSVGQAAASSTFDRYHFDGHARRS